MKRHVLVLTFCACFLGSIFVPITAQANLTTEQLSHSLLGNEGNSDSYEPTVSANGRYVAFQSYASNLVPDDSNGFADVFVRDRQTGSTERVSVSSVGDEGNGNSSYTAISSDGRYVAFVSSASNLVAGDTNSVADVFVRDRQTNSTERVSVSSAGVEGNGNSSYTAISSDGRYIAFSSLASNLVSDDTNGQRDVFVRDRQNSTTERVSISTAGIEGDDQSFVPTLSVDGRYIAFLSNASNLVSGDGNNSADVFVRDRENNSTERVSVSTAGIESNADSYTPFLSANGRYVAFASSGSNLVSGDSNNARDVFVRDRENNSTERVSVSAAGIEGNAASYTPTISADGLYVAFASSGSNLVPGDTNVMDDTFIHDRQTGSTERVSVSTTGIQGNANSYTPFLSGDGRYVAFGSAASNLASGDTNSVADVFVRDRQTGSTERVSLSPTVTTGNSPSFTPALSANGRYVVFDSAASNLVPGDSNNVADVFVRDRQTGSTERVSVSSTGTQGNNSSYDSPTISADGRYVAFYSDASNLVPGDTNNKTDVFVHDRQTGSTERVSVSSTGIQGNNQSVFSVLSADGRYVAFQSLATNLVQGVTNNVRDIFVHDRQARTTERVSVSSTGIASNSDSSIPSISADGDFVAFYSHASNLVPNDTNDVYDVFVRDRQAGTTERVSVSYTGSGGDNQSTSPSISADGRYVAFFSTATNLVPDDTNNIGDVFVRDRQTGTNERVSLSSNGIAGNGESAVPAISADGRFVAFYSNASNFVLDDTNNLRDIFVRDRQNNTTERVSVSSTGIEGNGESETPAISADGHFVAFESVAFNLVPDDSNAAVDVFVRDLLNNTTERVSLGSVAPAAPILLTPADGLVTLNTRSVFTWTSVVDADHYVLRLDTVNPPANIVYSGNLLTYMPPAPLSPVTYYWQVAAIDAVGNLSAVDTRTITIISPENAAPPRNYYTTSTPTLTWNSVSWAVRYEIQVDDTLTFSSPLDFTASIPADRLSVMTTSLVNNTYYWHVRACPAAGACKAWSATDSFVVDS